ncbi:MAG: sulfatase-like hydrolase/transferase [Planctomycetes bacterium]|nr:sulfatase-like hydrolase/transferase [Planctomycetota bacterium]
MRTEGIGSMNRRGFLKAAGVGAAALALPRWRRAAEAAPAPAGGRKPNIIFFLTDDMGWGDPSCYGNPELKTPNIDRLASEGVRFTQFYSASPICSPSRVGFTTGMYPARWRITSYLQTRAGNRIDQQADWLDPKAPVLARALRAAGYATAHVGKWHMGGGRDVDDAPLPQAYGFDESWTTWEGMGPGIDNDPAAKGTPRFRRTQAFVEKAMDFIRRHKDRPFYVNVWPNDVHDPHVADPELKSKYDTAPPGHQNFNAVLDEYDRQFGRLLDFLKAEGLAENTLVVFSSDNGPNPPFQDHRRSGGLRGMKWSLYEGGIRMPFIVRWPGRIPAGKVDERTVVGAVDLLPTVCSLAGVNPPEAAALDGEDMSRAWLGAPQDRARPLFWEYGRNPHFLYPSVRYSLGKDRKADDLYPDVKNDRSPNVAVREGRWKLLINADGSGAELYDLEADVRETANVAGKNPDVAKALSRKALAWRMSLPSPGPSAEGTR